MTHDPDLFCYFPYLISYEYSLQYAMLLEWSFTYLTNQSSATTYCLITCMQFKYETYLWFCWSFRIVDIRLSFFRITTCSQNKTQEHEYKFHRHIVLPDIS